MRRGGQPVGGGEQGGAPRPDPYPARNEGRLAKTRLRALEVQPLSRASDGDAHQRACDRRLPSFLLETTVEQRTVAGRWTSAPPPPLNAHTTESCCREPRSLCHTKQENSSYPSCFLQVLVLSTFSSMPTGEGGGEGGAQNCSQGKLETVVEKKEGKITRE